MLGGFSLLLAKLLRIKEATNSNNAEKFIIYWFYSKFMVELETIYNGKISFYTAQVLDRLFVLSYYAQNLYAKSYICTIFILLNLSTTAQIRYMHPDGMFKTNLDILLSSPSSKITLSRIHF